MNVNIQVDKKRKEVYINGKRATRLYTGSARMCFVGGHIIVKVAFDTSWKHADRKVYNRIAPEDRPFFVPIIASGRGWIAQPYYAAKRGRRPDWAREIVDKLVDYYGLFDTAGATNTNWMMIVNGYPIIYDYGLV